MKYFLNNLKNHVVTRLKLSSHATTIVGETSNMIQPIPNVLFGLGNLKFW